MSLLQDYPSKAEEEFVNYPHILVHIAQLGSEVLLFGKCIECTERMPTVHLHYAVIVELQRELLLVQTFNFVSSIQSPNS